MKNLYYNILRNIVYIRLIAYHSSKLCIEEVNNLNLQPRSEFCLTLSTNLETELIDA